MQALCGNPGTEKHKRMDPAERKRKTMKQQYRSVCPYDCPDSCGLLMTVEDGKITKVQGDPDHPVTRGFLCRKMQHYEEDIYSPQRIMTPYRRVGGKGKKESFVPITWKEAVEEICRRWKQIIGTYGADTIVPYSYAGTMGVIQRNCGEAFFNLLGGAELGRTVCGIGRGTAFELVAGKHTCLPVSEITDRDVILVYSDDPESTHIHAVPFLKQAKKNGAKILMVDVYANSSASLCDDVFLIRPGTDSAFLMAVMNELDRQGLLDKDYIEACTTGFPELRDEFCRWTPEKAAEVCGLTADRIREFALIYGKAERPVILPGYGFSRCTNGGAAAALLQCLPAVTGAWKRGGGIAGGIGASSFSSKNAVRRPDLAPEGKRRHINMNQLGMYLTDPAKPVRSLYVYHSNPAVMAPAQSLIRKGLEDGELFLVVHDRFFTDTAVLADIVLPAVFSVEQDDVFESYGHYHIQTGRKILDPPGECRSNWDVFRALAEGMGFADPCFDKTEEELLEELIDVYGLWDGLISEEKKEELRSGRPVMITVPDVQTIPTKDGRFHLSPRDMGYRPHSDQKYPLRLVMSHSPWAVNSNFSYNERLMKARGGPALRMHAQDAARRDLRDGDMAWAYNDLGRIRVKVCIIDGILPGTVNAEGVFQDDWCYEGGNFSALTAPEVSDSGGGSLQNNSSIEVVKEKI